MDRKRPVPSQEKSNGGKKRKTDKDRIPLNDPSKSNQPSTSETQCTWFNSLMAILDYTLVNDIVFLCVSLFVCVSVWLSVCLPHLSSHLFFYTFGEQYENC